MTDEIRQEHTAPTEAANKQLYAALDQLKTYVKVLLVELTRETREAIAESDRRVATAIDKLVAGQEASDEVMRLLAKQTEAVLAAVETSSGSDAGAMSAAGASQEEPVAPALDQFLTAIKALLAESTQQQVAAISEVASRLRTTIGELASGQKASDDIVRLLTERTAAVLAAVETSSESEAGAAAASARLADQIRVFDADLERWQKVNRRRGRWLTIAGVAAAIPAALFLGLLVQHQFEPITIEDPTHGWRANVWQSHGQAIKKCMIHATREQKPVNCRITAAPSK